MSFFEKILMLCLVNIVPLDSNASCLVDITPLDLYALCLVDFSYPLLQCHL